MSKKCINCGASTSTKANECEYCGSPQYLSLAHKSSFFSDEIKDTIFQNLQNEDKNDLDDKLSLISGSISRIFFRLKANLSIKSCLRDNSSIIMLI